MSGPGFLEIGFEFKNPMPKAQLQLLNIIVYLMLGLELEHVSPQVTRVYRLPDK